MGRWRELARCRPDSVQLSSATYLGSQALSWEAAQVSFLRNEDFLAAERTKSVSESMWCVAGVERPRGAGWREWLQVGSPPNPTHACRASRAARGAAGRWVSLRG